MRFLYSCSMDTEAYLGTEPDVLTEAAFLRPFRGEPGRMGGWSVRRPRSLRGLLVRCRGVDDAAASRHHSVERTGMVRGNDQSTSVWGGVGCECEDSEDARGVTVPVHATGHCSESRVLAPGDHSTTGRERGGVENEVQRVSERRHANPSCESHGSLFALLAVFHVKRRGR
jgi:hypothetical protein